MTAAATPLSAAAVKESDVGRVEDVAEYFWPSDRL